MVCKNVNTYLNNDNQGQRKGYSCDILGKTVYDDCSSYVSSCLVYLGIITSTQYNSRAYNKDDPDYKPSLGYALEGLSLYGISLIKIIFLKKEIYQCNIITVTM